MTLANIAGIIGGGIVGLLIGMWWGWGARAHNIARQGYTMITVEDKLYIGETASMVEALERANAEMDNHELREGE